MRNYAETFYLYKGYNMTPEYWHIDRNVRIRLFWDVLQVSIAQKRGAPPSRFLTKLHHGSMAFTTE